MILTGNSPVNHRLDMIRNPRSMDNRPAEARREAPERPQRIFDKASELFYLKGIRASGWKRSPRKRTPPR